MITVDRTPLNYQTTLPERRLELRAGLFSAVDFFDYNSEASDPHHQFLNWAIDNDGWYDYPADTRGYTYGIMATYKSPRLAARFLEAAMPNVANGETLDLDKNTHSESYEVEFPYKSFITSRPGIIRLLAFENHADMGNYNQAIKTFEAGYTPTPEITAVQKPGTVKYGFGINIEHEIADEITVFSRVGFNNGATETYTYTEVDNTLVLGVGVQGSRWKRPTDKLGFALVSNGLSQPHRHYLALGGLGFDLGDGGLNYGRENLGEIYYTCHLWKGLYFGPDFQYVINPGYNRARGPVPVFGLRLHVDI
jgi:carbohydrate-selective porin OprB